MAQLKRKHSTRPIQTFKQSIGEKAILAGLILLLGIIISIVMVQFTFDTPVMFIFLLFFIGLYAYLIVTIFMSLNIKTHIYENGIGVEQGNSYTFTSWDNLAYFEVRKVDKSTVTGIVTHEPIERRVPGGFIERMLHYKGDMHFMEVGAVSIPRQNNGIFKPQTVNEERLVRTDFGKHLLEYAPHLFREVKAR